MGSKYKVSFEVEGDYLGDDTPLDEDGIEEAIMFDFDSSSASYYGNRSIDTTVSDLKIEEMKGGAHNGTVEEESS